MKKSIVSKILITLGLVLIITSFGLKIYSKNKEVQAIEEFNKKIALQQKEEDEGKKEEIDMTKKKSTGNKKIAIQIALIEIPSIDLESVIVEGVEKEKLRYYLCYFEETARPGEIGNFSISGHSSVIYNEILNNLHKVKIGDEIKIKTEKDDFIYTITEKFIVEPTEIGVLDQDTNKRMMTIVTCTDKGRRRLIVKAEMK